MVHHIHIISKPRDPSIDVSPGGDSDNERWLAILQYEYICNISSDGKLIELLIDGISTMPFIFVQKVRHFGKSRGAIRTPIQQSVIFL